jgi:hypothetical protein
MSQPKKNSEEYLIENCDKAINELVYDKVHLIKAYNYYAGIRDKMQFAHLEDNYGLGNPTSLVFTPLVRKYIDSLVGEYLTIPLEPKISCKDQETLSHIFREKQLAIAKETTEVINNYLVYRLQKLLGNGEKSSPNQPTTDKDVQKRLDDVTASVENNFISEYEMAAQDIIQFLLQSRDVDFENKARMLLLDRCIAGEMYYRVVPTPEKNGIEIEVCDPINTFVDININSPYLKNSYRSVVRKWLSKTEIIQKYGDDLSEEDIDELDNQKIDYTDNNMVLLNAVNTRTGCLMTDGILAGIEAGPRYNQRPVGKMDLYPVYEVEWLDFEKHKEGIKTYRYSSVRIGQDIYVLTGRDEESIRSITRPNECTLQLNGMLNMSRTGRPFSMILATADLQDKYDILIFYRDNLIANSGAIGDWIDVAHLPTFLGVEITERLQKFVAYKKQGLALYDSSQEGNIINTAFNGYDDTTRLQAIQAIELAIQSIENTASQITGISQQRLGNVEQRDAVANVRLGVQASQVITKQHEQAMDLIVSEVLLDALNLAKIVYKDGLSGMLILGENKRRLFTALPQFFTLTDFDIHIADHDKTVKEQEFLKSMSTELVRAGAVDPEMLLATATSHSLTEMKVKLENNLFKKKEENNQIQQLTQQLQQAQEQMKQQQQALEEAQRQLKKFNAQELQLEKYKIDKNYEAAMQKLKVENDYKDSLTKLQQKRVDLETVQLLDNNPKNDEIKDK